MECLVGDNMYPLFSDTRGVDTVIDWQLKIMDYITDQLENVPCGTAIIFTKEELHKNVCPDAICWAPCGIRHFWIVRSLLKLVGININSDWENTMSDEDGYFMARKWCSNDLD